jgi:hypothetical protein
VELLEESPAAGVGGFDVWVVRFQLPRPKTSEDCGLKLGWAERWAEGAGHRHDPGRSELVGQIVGSS